MPEKTPMICPIGGPILGPMTTTRCESPGLGAETPEGRIRVGG
jgi:hypothetical protein